MKKQLMLLIFYFLSIISYSQEYKFFKYSDAFENTDTVLLIQPDKISCNKSEYLKLIEYHQPYNENVKLISKSIGNLEKKDLSKRIIFFGLAQDFIYNKEYFPEIFSLQPKGFHFGPLEFTDSLDVIYFYSSDSTRLYHIGNSLAALSSVWNTYTAIYQFNIMQNFANTYHGELNHGKFDKDMIVDMVGERNEKMYLKKSKYYNLYYSKEFPKNKIDSLFLCKADSITENIINVLELQQPNRKIDCFLYSSKEEKIRLSHTLGEGNAIIEAWQNHCISLGSLEHESVHILFGNQIQTKDFWTFLNEGIVMYYCAITNNNYGKRLMEKMKQKENIPIEKYLTEKKAFWNGSDLSYPLSGHFCKFLIEKYGLDSFKKLFVIGLENGFEEVYGLTMEEIIDKWIVFKNE